MATCIYPSQSCLPTATTLSMIYYNNDILLNNDVIHVLKITKNDIHLNNNNNNDIY